MLTVNTEYIETNYPNDFLSTFLKESVFLWYNRYLNIEELNQNEKLNISSIKDDDKNIKVNFSIPYYKGILLEDKVREYYNNKNDIEFMIEGHTRYYHTTVINIVKISSSLEFSFGLNILVDITLTIYK